MKRNIIWATGSYAALGEYYRDSEQITAIALQRMGKDSIQPRILKAQEEQQQRTRKHGEVQTPAWLCCRMNDFLDETWFERENVFNVQDGQTWAPAEGKIVFPNHRHSSWRQYVDSRRLEITCGEAPFIVSRYDAATGEAIPIERRIGLLDRKLRIVGENTDSEAEWVKWAIRAIESVYGYEYQGDNLLIARINVLLSFVEYLQSVWHRGPTEKELATVAKVISWNFFQMDGLTDTVPKGKLQAPEAQPITMEESFITGQYFQSQISSTMKALNRDVRGIKGFLESERKGTFQSYVNWLQSHAEHLKHIQIDDDRRKNAAQDVGHMVRFFDDTISSSAEHIEVLLDSAKNNYSAEDVSQVFSEIANNLYLYHQSLSLYCNSVNLLICLYKIVNPDEINSYCNDMISRITDYQSFKTDCIDRLNEYLSKVDVLNKRSGWKSFLSGIKGLGMAGLDLAAYGGWGVLLAALDGKDVVSTSNKKYDAELIKQKNKLIDEMNKALAPCHDLSNANESVASLRYYLRAIKRLEIVKMGNTLYTNMPSPTH